MRLMLARTFMTHPGRQTGTSRERENHQDNDDRDSDNPAP
jgi:hypothetical protein